MIKYQDGAPVQSRVARPNLLQSSQRGSTNNTANAAQGVLGSLSSFFDRVGGIADEFGKQNAQIQGVQEAQDNTVEWLKAKDTKAELEQTLSDPKLPDDKRMVAEQELAKVDDTIKTYISATKQTPTINLKEVSLQKTQAQLFKTNLINEYTKMTEQAYEKFVDDPKGFEEASKNLTKKFMDTLPSDVIGESLTAFKSINSQVASKVHQNYVTKQNDIIIADTKKNIDESIDYGTKFAYSGGDYSTQMKNIIDSYSTLYQKRLITKEQYEDQVDKIKKEFRSQKYMGQFDRIIGFDPAHKFTPNAHKIRAGYKEIDKFTNIMMKKKGESLEEYKARTDGFNQHEVDKMINIMRNKLAKAEASLKLSIKTSQAAYGNKSKIAYKMMWKGVKPDFYNELKKEAYANGDQQAFDEADLAMRKIQAVNDMTIEDKKAYIANYDKKKKTGASEMDFKINSVVNTNVKKSISLAQKDPVQLAVDEGMFHPLTKMQDENGNSDFGAILNELKYRATNGKNQMFAKYETTGKSLLSDEEAAHFGHVITSNPAQAPQIIRNVYKSVGNEEANKIFKAIYPKKSSGVIYSAVISAEKPIVADNIILGIDAEKNGAKLTTEDEKAYNDFMRSDTVIATLGKAGPGIRQAIRGYYFSMPKKDINEAVTEVTNGIDNGIIVYKKGLDYDDVYGNMVDFADRWEKGYKTKFKHRLNGVPSVTYDTFIKALRDGDYKLVTVSQRGYSFKTKDLGTYLTNTKGQKLVFTFRKDD